MMTQPMTQHVAQLMTQNVTQIMTQHVTQLMTHIVTQTTPKEQQSTYTTYISTDT